jgi:hypothetical protein
MQDKTYEHTMAVYKNFAVTEACENAEMEERSNKANNARKVIQQIALYFDYFPSTEKWAPKTSHRLLLDASLWRCIAFLNMWSISGCVSQRSRLIAVFYASFYIYTCAGMMRFEDWHARVWRQFCIENYESGSFLGYSHMAHPIDTRVVVARLQHVSKQIAMVVCEDIPRGLSQVYDERTMFDFMCAKKGADYGTDRLLKFFSYNFKNIKPAVPRLKSALAATSSRILTRRQGEP